MLCKTTSISLAILSLTLLKVKFGFTKIPDFVVLTLPVVAAYVEVDYFAIMCLFLLQENEELLVAVFDHLDDVLGLGGLVVN